MRMRGFAALTMTLIVCSVLTVAAIAASTSAYLARLSSLEFEYKQIGRGYAYACAQAVMLELSSDPGYRPHEDGDMIRIAPDMQCRIASITKEQETLMVIVSGEYHDSYTHLELRLLLDSAIPGSGFRTLFFREI